MVMDKRTIVGMVQAGESLIQQAVDAFRAYHEAKIVANQLKRSSACTCLPSHCSRRCPTTSFAS